MIRSVGMDIQIVMRTTDRAAAAATRLKPRRQVDYLAATVRQLVEQGIRSEQVHLCPTDPDVRWISEDVRSAVTLHLPERRYSATENMGIALAMAPTCDWVLHLEDDVTICRDFLGSVARWLETYMTDAVRLAAFFMRLAAIRSAYRHRRGAVPCPATDWRSAVAFGIRWHDAQACARWITDHAATWRVGPRYQQWARRRGADKMIGAWHAEAYPAIRAALASVPCLVEHEGRVSSLRGIGHFRYVRAPIFTGEPWQTA